ncbi:chromosome partitioning protein ParB [Serinicoccus chungangensis]|uniref:Chromosome partitioning protein ParB n=1 Tax=Serinicoccus chungangensis TaxID=767452 RepID=A0A0W8I417_9MICO|nr:ParB/RepB/Spo0J family partition protein [Serinicoccus chungangensis]KUG52476.1 chromosome partitioning protein ParB [Serinicoccus chungangensis]
MTDRRRGLGRGLGALIPQQPAGDLDRPRDVFFPRGDGGVPAPVATPDPASEPAPADDPQVAGGGADAGSAGSTGNEHPRRTGQPEAVTEADAPDDGLAPVPGASFAEIDLDQIRANPRQPRSVFDEDDLAELVSSIRELGVLQPVVVRPTDPAEVAAGEPPYELVMGERRLRASRSADQSTIPAIVRATEDEHMLRDALLENLHRAQLNPLEEAAAYQQLLEDFGCTHDELAGRIGRSRPQISNTIRLLRLPPMVQRRVASGVLSAGHARALLGLADGAAMERLAQRIVAEGLSVRSVEEIVMMGDEDRPTRRRATGSTPSPELEQIASSLSGRLDTRVQVSMGRRKGKMVIEFAGQDDLERILDLLGRDDLSPSTTD